MKIACFPHKTYKYFNKYQLLSDLKDDFGKTNFEHDLDNVVSNMSNTLLRNMNKHVPLVTRSVKHIHQPKWFCEEIKHAMKERDTYKKRRDHEKYVRCRNNVVYTIRRIKSNYYKNVIEK